VHTTSDKRKDTDNIATANSTFFLSKVKFVELPVVYAMKRLPDGMELIACAHIPCCIRIH